MPNVFFKDCFINGLKEAIKAQIKMYHLATWLEASQQAKKAQAVVTTQTNIPILFNGHILPLCLLHILLRGNFK
jgi:hypothetical protein